MTTSVSHYERVAAELPVGDDGTAGIVLLLCNMGATYDTSSLTAGADPWADVLAKLKPVIAGTGLERVVTEYLLDRSAHFTQ